MKGGGQKAFLLAVMKRLVGFAMYVETGILQKLAIEKRELGVKVVGISDEKQYIKMMFQCVAIMR